MVQNIKKNLLKLVFFALFFSSGTFLFFSLTFFEMNGPTFFKFDSSMDNRSNPFSLANAFFLGHLIQAIGDVAYFIAFVLVFWSLKVLKNQRPEWKSFFMFPFALVSLAVIFEASLFDFRFNLDGGILGQGLQVYLSIYLFNFLSEQTFIILIFLLAFVAATMTLNVSYKESKLFLSYIWRFLMNSTIFLLYLLRLKKQLNFFRSNKVFNSKIKRTKSSASEKKLNSQIKEDYSFPSIELLESPIKITGIENENKKNAEINKKLLKNVLNDFKVSGEITNVKQGPIVTLFELTPAPGTLSSSVIRLADDIARSMSAISTRISTIVGKDALGIEIPNKRRETVYLREILNSDNFRESQNNLPMALGKDIFGNPVVVDLQKMPHLLVAGTTGSGKSVGINAMLLSLLYMLPPDECKLILIDPKMLELSVYQDIPHLLTEVVTDPKKAVSALKWTVKEMESRYRMMQHLGVRDVEAFNKRAKQIIDTGEIIYKEVQVGYDPETGNPVMEKKPLDIEIFPKIIVVVDELADLMITSGKEIEGAIQRLSQMARAAGIHLIVATQRPSVDVITGTIKSNFPTRVSYKVVNKINSRTILEKEGAEQLLGQGDLLITMFGEEKLIRVHGPFVKTEEVQAVVEHLKKQGEPSYLNAVTKEEDEGDNIPLGLNEGGDELYNQAVSIVCREKKASTSFIQRHLQIGYNRAARIIERMESEGIVSPANHVGRREVLVGKDN